MRWPWLFLSFFALSIYASSVSASTAKNRYQRSTRSSQMKSSDRTSKDQFMSIASQLQDYLEKGRFNNPDIMLQQGFKNLETQIAPDSQTKEMVALNLIALMKLYRAIVNRNAIASQNAYLPNLKRAKNHVLLLAKQMITLFARNQEGNSTRDQGRILNERLKLFSQIFAACAEALVWKVSNRIKTEQQSGHAQDVSSFTNRIRRYYQSSQAQSPRHDHLFKQFEVSSEKIFLDRVGACMIKLLGLRAGNPPVFSRRVSFTAAAVGIFGYSTIMSPSPLKSALFMALISATTVYFQNQFRPGPTRQFSRQLKEFQSGDSLDRTARACAAILNTIKVRAAPANN